MHALLIYNDVCKQLWDMRNVMSPVKEFVGHTKGTLDKMIPLVYLLMLPISLFRNVIIKSFWIWMTLCSVGDSCSFSEMHMMMHSTNMHGNSTLISSMFQLIFDRLY